jgi:hypothetical protein
VAQRLDFPLLARYLKRRASQRDVLSHFTSVDLNGARNVLPGGNPLVRRLVIERYRDLRDIEAAVRDNDIRAARVANEAEERSDGNLEAGSTHFARAAV